jgi:hypothetical protein
MLFIDINPDIKEFFDNAGNTLYYKHDNTVLKFKMDIGYTGIVQAIVNNKRNKMACYMVYKDTIVCNDSLLNDSNTIFQISDNYKSLYDDYTHTTYHFYII